MYIKCCQKNKQNGRRDVDSLVLTLSSTGKDKRPRRCPQSFISERVKPFIIQTSTCWDGKKSVNITTRQFHNPSITFWHPSSKLCHNWLHHWRGNFYLHTAAYQTQPYSLKLPVPTVKKKLWNIWVIRQWELHSAEACMQTSGVPTLANKSSVYIWTCEWMKMYRMRIKKLPHKNLVCSQQQLVWGFVCADVSTASAYKRNTAWWNFSHVCAYKILSLKHQVSKLVFYAQSTSAVISERISTKEKWSQNTVI